MRSLRLRLIKTDRIDTTEFNITSVQDDHSEIKLSSGRISVDLLHKREMGKDEGTSTYSISVVLSFCGKDILALVTFALAFVFGLAVDVFDVIIKTALKFTYFLSPFVSCNDKKSALSPEIKQKMKFVI